MSLAHSLFVRLSSRSRSPTDAPLSARTEPAFTLQPTRKPADGPRGLETFLEQVEELEQPDMELLLAAYDIYVQDATASLYERAANLIALDVELKTLIRAMIENDPEGARFAVRHMPFALEADTPGVLGHA